MLRIKIVKRGQVIHPVLAKSLVKEYIEKAKRTRKDLIFEVDEYDYFTIKFVDVFSKIEDVPVIYEYEGKEYLKMYEIEKLAALDLIDELYDLDVEASKIEEGEI